MMSGEMSLWEYGAIVHEWNERQPKEDGAVSEYHGPIPTEEQMADMKERTARTVARANGAHDAGR